MKIGVLWCQIICRPERAFTDDNSYKTNEYGCGCLSCSYRCCACLLCAKISGVFCLTFCLMFNFIYSLSQQLMEINTNRRNMSPWKSFGQNSPQEKIKQNKPFRGLKTDSCHLCFDISTGHVLIFIPDQFLCHDQRDTQLSG